MKPGHKGHEELRIIEDNHDKNPGLRLPQDDAWVGSQSYILHKLEEENDNANTHKFETFTG